MSNSETQIENQKSKIENPTSVWDQLRQSMERLSSGGRSTADPAALAIKLANRAKMLRGRMADAKPTEAPLSFLAFRSGHERLLPPYVSLDEYVGNHTEVEHPQYVGEGYRPFLYGQQAVKNFATLPQVSTGRLDDQGNET